MMTACGDWLEQPQQASAPVSMILWRMGRRKAAVLPEPVWDQAMRWIGECRSKEQGAAGRGQ